MATIYGTLEGFSSKTVTSSKTGKAFQISIGQFRDSAGNLVDVELGFANKAKALGLLAGNFYEIDTKFNYGKHEYVSHKQASASSAPAAGASVPKNTESAGLPYYEKNAGFLVKQFPVPIDHPDRSIIRQNAMAHAVKIIELTGYAGSLSEASLEPADMNDMVLAEVRRIAMQVEDFATGDYERRMLEAMENGDDA